MAAVIVGAGPGTGAAVARRFGSQGFPIALISRKLETTTPLKEQLEKGGVKAAAYAADSAVDEQVDRAFEQITKDFGGVEVLVYNATGGTWPPRGVEETTVEAFRAGLEVGAVGAFLWAKKVIPGFKERQRGTILLTGATAGMRGGARFSSFSPGKFALRSLSQTLARELGPSGVHVAHIIIDGMIDTPRVAGMAGAAKDDDSRLSPDAIAEAYWQLHTQHRSAWTQELDLRPWSEKF